MTLVGGAIDFLSNVPLDGMSAKCEAGSVALAEAVAHSSIVLQAGDASLLGRCGTGHHFVELEAGEARISLSRQTDLMWRVQTDLGDIKDRRSGSTHESPYSGVVGSGAAHLICTLNLGDVEIT